MPARLLAVLLALAALPAAAAGASAQDAVPADAPEWLPMSDATARAETEGKILLVYAYAPWCGWCARADREVYTDDAVQAYLAEHFAATRLDVESPAAVSFFEHTVSQARLASAFGVSATPTTVFVSPSGEALTRYPGFADARTYRVLLQFVAEAAYETEPFQAYLARANAAAR